MAKPRASATETKDKKRGRNKDEEIEEGRTLKSETKRGIYAVLCFLLAFLFMMSAFNNAGVAGEFIYTIFQSLFGFGYVIVPLACIGMGVVFMRSDSPKIPTIQWISMVLLVLGTLSVLDIASGENHSGGSLGALGAYPFVELFGVYAGLLMLGGIIIISLLVLFDERPNLMRYLQAFARFFKRKDTPVDEEFDDLIEDEEEEEEEIDEDEEPEEKKTIGSKVKKALGIEESEIPEIAIPRLLPSSYTPPPLSLLEKDKGRADTGDIKANANIIKRTLQNFGIEVEMAEITVGPTVTRYALKPAEGVKLSRIVGLQNDLALALAAHPLRIEAPIPGKSLVGIEIPNKSKSMVGLASLLSDTNFQNGVKPLLIAIGRNIAGKAVVTSLAKMPHLLIAGTTGSGKSVSIHAIITSLLYRQGPADLKFIMVDPKRVELTLYNKIPHLLTPVITDPKKAILALKWAAQEMSRRYDILESESVRDISSYHANIVHAWHEKNKKGTNSEVGRASMDSARHDSAESSPDPMPYIVVIIDELADIMQAYPRELEAAIVRLAQMSRAVGIHLILSTQRPEVNVITGLIKANVPARIALRVPTQIDSRTILDAGGAEKLLGAGDMLCLAGDTQQPERLQSAYISEEEVKKVVKYLSDAYRDEITDEINLTGPLSVDKSIFESQIDSGDDEDDLYEDARSVVLEAGKASTSYIQRKLKVGYARAARLIDMLEDRGVVGPGDGAKPREVLEGGNQAQEEETL